MLQQKIQKLQRPVSAKSNSSILLFFFFWLLPILWVAAIPRNTVPKDEEFFTSSLLKNGQLIIKKFQENFGYVPRTLSEIRIFAKSINKNFIPFDGYGQRLDYFNFDHEQWYLRSFGKDGKQNTLLSPLDPLVSNLFSDIEAGIQHQYPTQSIYFNPIILAGSTSPKNDWYAKLYQNPINGSSKLIVRHKTKKNYFLIATHNTIEEFYWHPEGTHIIYTATGSNRYKDGIFLWNLQNDQTTPIFPTKNTVDAATYNSETQFWNITLAGISNQTPPKLMAYINSRTQPELHIENFYIPENLLVFNLPHREKNKLEKVSDTKPFHNNALNDMWNPMLGIANCQTGQKLQQDWCSLPLDGNLEQVIEQWQDYGEKAAKLPQFPYTLWQLILMYEKMMAHLENSKSSVEQSKNFEIVRSYGLELSVALSNLPIAPSWMRAAALAKQQRFKGSSN